MEVHPLFQERCIILQCFACEQWATYYTSQWSAGEQKWKRGVGASEVPIAWPTFQPTLLEIAVEVDVTSEPFHWADSSILTRLGRDASHAAAGQQFIVWRKKRPRNSAVPLMTVCYVKNCLTAKAKRENLALMSLYRCILVY